MTKPFLHSLEDERPRGHGATFARVPKHVPVVTAAFIFLLSCCLSLAAEFVVEIRFHGNYSIPDDEMARLAGVTSGVQVTDSLLEDIKARLMRSKRFEWVMINKRYRSLGSTDLVVLIITVKEKPPARSKFMFMPILAGSDEYGIAYGGRITAIALLGAEERLSVPLTWGGVRRAALESSVDVKNPVISSLNASTGISWKKNPHFKIGDLRREVGGGISRRFGDFQIDWNTGWTGVDFGDLNQSFVSCGAGFTLDTRQDVNLPRNAVYTGLGWERMSLRAGGPHFNRYKIDLRGYRGLFGQAVLAGQFLYHVADGRLPDYERPFLGGSSTLRGHKPGAYIGDNIAICALELRIPMTSARKVYHAGVDFFFDSGAVFDHGQSTRDADFKHGAGAGLFLLVAGFGVKVDVAYNMHDSVRVHFA